LSLTIFLEEKICPYANFIILYCTIVPCTEETTENTNLSNCVNKHICKPVLF